MSPDVLRRGFADICNGYSKGELFGKPVYIKHLGHIDQLDLDTIEKKFYNLAKKRGLPTEANRLAQLKNEGRWKDEDEKELETRKLAIDSLIAGRKNAPLPSVLKRINEQIAEEQKLYDKKRNERIELLGLTCESNALRRLNEHYISQNLFQDNLLTKRFFTEEEFNHLDDMEVATIMDQYNQIVEPCSELNIKKIALQDFFQSYYYVCGDDFSAFYGRPIIRMTLYQIKLANYAKYFRNIFDNYDTRNMPKELFDDPDKIIDWVLAADRAKKQVEKHQDSAMSAHAGMTAEDRKAIGQTTGPDPFMEALKKKGGGSLGKEEIMKVFGKR